MRLRPTKLRVDPEEPFAHDMLEREEPVEALSRILAAIDGPGVVSVDAPWGAGKTTFLDMLSAVLSNGGFRVARFNAWTTDFSRQPFATLSSELLAQLDEDENSRVSGTLPAFRAAAAVVLRKAIPMGIRLGTGGLVAGESAGEEIADLLAGLSEDALSAYEEGKRSLENFRVTLGETSAAVKESTGLPLVVVIDELDRCRPTYAIELLEVIKHLFGVDGVVFVMAIDVAELAHSVSAVYGAGFDGKRYLRRFIDVDYQLPSVSRTGFIAKQLEETGVNSFFKRTEDRDARGTSGLVQRMFELMLTSAQVGLRDVSQAIYRLGLVLSSMPSDRRAFPLASTCLIVLRTLDRELYVRFVRGQASDEEVLDHVFSRPELAGTRKEHAADLFVAGIMCGAQEFEGPTPKLDRVRELARMRQNREEGPDEDEQDEAANLAFLISNIRNSMIDKVGFTWAADRIELVSGELDPALAARSDDEAVT